MCFQTYAYVQSVYEFKLDDQVYAHRMSDVASSHALIAGMYRAYLRQLRKSADDNLLRALPAGSLDPRIRLCDMRSGSAAQMLAGRLN